MASNLMQKHASERRIIFGVNHELRDFGTGRKKKLDLVIARPRPSAISKSRGLLDLGDEYSVNLDPAERLAVVALPRLVEGPVGAVLVALEAKAAMTKHAGAKPRLYDELTSSHSTVHGASTNALAVGLVMVNSAVEFLSPTGKRDASQKPIVNKHTQPRDAESVIEKLRELPRRTTDHGAGFDGLAVVVVDSRNDGKPIELVTSSPAPQPGDVYHYENMIARVAHEYDARFRSI
jgi:hypothetical protein